MTDQRSPEKHASSSRTAFRESLWPSWRLSWIALVLFVLFGTIIADVALPPKLLDPTWQLALFSAVVSTAGFPLVGMGLLHLASDLDPTNKALRNQRRFCARLAVPVALGFVLMVPLQAFSLWQQNSTMLVAREAQLSRAEANLSSLRQAVEDASTIADLQNRLKAINRPALSAVELTQPLPMLKLQARASLEQAEAALRQQRQRLPRGGVFSIMQISLRNAVACLALALGFAALAQRRYSQVPLLQELLHGFKQMRTKVKAYWNQLTKKKCRRR